MLKQERLSSGASQVLIIKIIRAFYMFLNNIFLFFKTSKIENTRWW